MWITFLIFKSCNFQNNLFGVIKTKRRTKRRTGASTQRCCFAAFENPRFSILSDTGNFRSPIPSHFGARTRFVNKPPACKRRTKRRSRCFHKPPTPVWKTSRFSTFPPRGLVHPSFFVNEKTHKAEDGCELQSRKSCECRRPPLCAPYIKTIIDETPRKARNTRPHIEDHRT